MIVACREYESLVEALADGELDVRQIELVRGHVTGCSACTAYHAELLALNGRLRGLAYDLPSPDITRGVVSAIRWRLRLRFGVIALGLLAMRLLDLLGYLGSGFTPRMIMAVGAVLAFVLLGFNPFRLARLTDLSDSHSSIEGERHVHS